MGAPVRLDRKKCQPCEGMKNPYALREADERLKNVTDWELHKNGKVIYRKYVTKNFSAAINFINKVAALAESEGHHPDFHLTGYRKLRIDLSTHAIGGLSENDFILAAKIEQIPKKLKQP